MVGESDGEEWEGRPEYSMTRVPPSRGRFEQDEYAHDADDEALVQTQGSPSKRDFKIRSTLVDPKTSAAITSAARTVPRARDYNDESSDPTDYTSDLRYSQADELSGLARKRRVDRPGRALQERDVNAASPDVASRTGGAGAVSTAANALSDSLAKDKRPQATEEDLRQMNNLPILTGAEMVGVIFLLILFGVVFFPLYQFYRNMPENWRELK